MPKVKALRAWRDQSGALKPVMTARRASAVAALGNRFGTSQTPLHFARRANAAERRGALQGWVVIDAEWSQDGGYPQRTGFTAEEPSLRWRFAWAWNGPDEKGGADGHHYHQPRPHEPWEARVCTGGSHVFAPAGKLGLFALNKEDGSVAWQFKGGTAKSLS